MKNIDLTNLSVQVGCGLRARNQWLNFDKSPSLLLSKVPGLNRIIKLPAWSPLARYGDIVSGLPIPDESCARIYADQVFEHLTREGFRHAIRNAYRYLAPGGVLRFFIPHLRQMADEYVANPDPQASHLFMLRLGMGVDQNYRGVEGFLRKLIGNSRHLWLWDEATLREELLQVGYQEIQSVVYGDSGDALFDMIELPVPWDFSLGTQALKPA